MGIFSPKYSVNISSDSGSKEDDLVGNEKFFIGVPENAPAFIEKFKS